VKRVDTIIKTLNQYFGCAVGGELAEVIENAIVDQIDAQVGTAYNEGYNDGYNDGCNEE
jgi:hypothetical protein